MDHNQRKETRSRVQRAVDSLLAGEINAVRGLVQALDANDLSLVQFMDTAIAFWNETLDVDRVFICDVRTGEIVAGWNKGLNIIKLQDWDESYVPLENDRTLQLALESDELIANPVDGVGADLAFSLPLDNGLIWLVVMDQTNVARRFSEAEMAYIELVRDLAIIKSRLRPD